MLPSMEVYIALLVLVVLHNLLSYFVGTDFPLFN